MAATKERNPKRPASGSPKPNGQTRPRPHANELANDSALSALPRLDDLPAQLPKSGIIASVHRSKLLAHPKNPREIDAYAEAELLESLKRSKGLREPPTWNRRNGFLVGGHQRLRMEDRRRGTQDYFVRTVVVDYDEAQHIEEMVAVNNESLMGVYSVPLLDELLQTPGVHAENMGFNPVSLEELFNSAGFDLPDYLLPEQERTTSAGQQTAGEIADRVAGQLDEADAAKKNQKDRNSAESIRDSRRQYQEQAAFEGQSDVHATLVFPTEELKRAFMRYIDRPELAERIDGVSLVRLLELDIPEFDSTTRDPAEGKRSDGKRTRSGTGDDHQPEHDPAQPGASGPQAEDDPNCGAGRTEPAADRQRDGGDHGGGGILRSDGGLAGHLSQSAFTLQPTLASVAIPSGGPTDSYDDL